MGWSEEIQGARKVLCSPVFLVGHVGDAFVALCRVVLVCTVLRRVRRSTDAWSSVIYQVGSSDTLRYGVRYKKLSRMLAWAGLRDEAEIAKCGGRVDAISIR